MSHASRIVGLTVCVVICGCGSTSNIKPDTNANGAPTSLPEQHLDLSAFDRVVVLDYVDATDKSGVKSDQLKAYSDSVVAATHAFPDLIAQKVQASKAFAEVLRGPSQGRALIVSGRITRLSEGNKMARLMLPGAGMSHFEAVTDLTDGESGRVLGHIATDKNSWGLGGAIAMSQSVQTFMDGAAGKISADLKQQKNPKVAAGN